MLQAFVPIPFGKPPPIHGQQQRHMIKFRRGQAQFPVEPQLARRAGQKVCPAHHLGNAHQGIIHHHGQLVGERAVRALHEEVSAVGGEVLRVGSLHLIDEGDTLSLGDCTFEVVHLPGHEDSSLLIYSRETGLLFSSDIYAVNRYWVADQFGAKGVKQDLLLSLHQQLVDIYTKDGATVKELYTGHNRIGMGADYLTIWEQCLQKLVNYGPDAVSHDRRGEGAVVVTDGDQYETMDWTSFSETGKQVRAEYTGTYDGKVYHRIEIDTRGTENEPVEDNLYFDYRTNAHLSNITFKDATLVGHDFKYKTGFDTADDTLEDGRLKYAIENKFVPYEFDYDVQVGSNSSVTFYAGCHV